MQQLRLGVEGASLSSGQGTPGSHPICPVPLCPLQWPPRAWPWGPSAWPSLPQAPSGQEQGGLQQLLMADMLEPVPHTGSKVRGCPLAPGLAQLQLSQVVIIHRGVGAWPGCWGAQGLPGGGCQGSAMAQWQLCSPTKFKFLPVLTAPEKSWKGCPLTSHNDCDP